MTQEWITMRLDLEDGESSKEPSCDIIKCQECLKEFDISKCPTNEEGDWESGYYLVHDCPECGDGGEPEYDMSLNQSLKWDEWYKKQNPQPPKGG